MQNVNKLHLTTNKYQATTIEEVIICYNIIIATDFDVTTPVKHKWENYSLTQM